MRRIFISYAHNALDRAAAHRLYHSLRASGKRPWLDEEDLLPGEDWARRVRDEIRQCQFFLALLSTRSLNHRGYVQSELRLALEVLDTIPIDERFLIPLRLDDCRPRDDRIARLHSLDLFPDSSYSTAYQRLEAALELPRDAGHRLYINVGLVIPPDIREWPDERLCQYFRTEVRAEARERALRDYENVPVGDPEAAIRIRTEEKLWEVAVAFGVVDRLRNCNPPVFRAT